MRKEAGNSRAARQSALDEIAAHFASGPSRDRAKDEPYLMARRALAMGMPADHWSELMEQARKALPAPAAEEGVKS